jgi:hypothetical protein
VLLFHVTSRTKAIVLVAEGFREDWAQGDTYYLLLDGYTARQLSDPSLGVLCVEVDLADGDVGVVFDTRGAGGEFDIYYVKARALERARVTLLDPQTGQIRRGSA